VLLGKACTLPYVDAMRMLYVHATYLVVDALHEQLVVWWRQPIWLQRLHERAKQHRRASRPSEVLGYLLEVHARHDIVDQNQPHFEAQRIVHLRGAVYTTIPRAQN
jgi:hypothetical protein